MKDLQTESAKKWETLRDEQARLAGLQRNLKARRARFNQEIAECFRRYRENGAQFDGRDLVPLRAAQDMVSAVTSLGDLERKIHRNRAKIRDVEKQLAVLKWCRIFTKAVERVFRQPPPTARDVLQSVLRVQGLHLHKNNEISNGQGKLVGWYGDDAKYDGRELTWTFKPIQTVEFIPIDVKLEIKKD